MWKIEIITAVVFTLTLIKATQQATSEEDTDEGYEHDCYAMCNSTGTKADFNKESLTCKCILTTNVDDAELALIRKNVKLLKLNLVSSKPTVSVLSKKNKRHISTGLAKNQFSHPNFHKKADPIVGQAFGQSNQQTITQNAALQRQLEQLRMRLRELTNRAQARGAHDQSIAFQDNIRGTVHGYNSEIASQQRARQSRLNQERRTQERQRLHFLNDQRMAAGGGARLHPARRIGGVVGSAANEDSTTLPLTNRNKEPQSNDDDVIPIKNPYGPIITQPEDLIDNN